MLNNYLNAPIQTGEAVIDNIVPALNNVLNHQSATSRIKASHGLDCISKVPNGRVYLVENDITNNIIVHLDDPNPKVKENCYYTLIHLTEDESSIKNLLDQNIVEKLINAIQHEKVQYQALALELLKNCQTTRTNEATLQALDLSIIFLIYYRNCTSMFRYN